MATINLNRKKRPRTNTSSKKEANLICYSTARWKRLRQWKLMHSPLCEDCLEGLWDQEERIEPAKEVHHEIPFMTGIDKYDKITLAFDSNNLRSLCIRHHHLRHPNKRKYDTT